MFFFLTWKYRSLLKINILQEFFLLGLMIGGLVLLEYLVNNVRSDLIGFDQLLIELMIFFWVTVLVPVKFIAEL